MSLTHSNHHIEHPVPFDFIVNGQLLRTSLRGYISRSNLNPEIILDLEYVVTIAPPTLTNKIEQDDWTSSLHVHEDSEQILVGSYDNIVRVWTKDGEKIAHGFGHVKPVKCVCWGVEGNDRFYSGSQDTKVFAWKKLDNKKSFKPCLRLDGHTKTVLSLSHNPASHVVCTVAPTHNSLLVQVLTMSPR